MHKKDILNDKGLTFAEKIISMKSNSSKRTGEFAIVDVDLTLAQDSTGPLAIKVFNEMGIRKAWDPKKIFIFLDHTYPAADEKVANLHHMVREFCSKHGCNIVEGSISHQHILENEIRPGMLLLGADSHTCQGGALGAFATGIGSTEMAAVWATGKLWLKIPETYKINVSGDLRKGVFARDIIMHLIGSIGEDGANYKSLEWHGETIRKLEMDSRACICNNAIECGAKNSVVEADHVTKSYMEKCKREPLLEVHAGKKAVYEKEIEIEAGELEPLASLPGYVDKVRPVSEIEGTEIDQAFIGSTTNCRIEDLEIAARILKNKKVKARLVITPASKKVYLQALVKGFIQIFLDAGAVFTNSTCGACVGTHMGVLGESEVCISCSPRNYTGRMGSFTAKVYLASPATCAASALEGKITDPRKYL